MRTTLFNFDDSVPYTGAECCVDLRATQEEVRFGCSWSTWRRFSHQALKLWGPRAGASPEIAFLGSGDFHHLSLLALTRLPIEHPINVLVLDNHPDNMRFPFGIHCGSWVYHATRLPQVKSITVAGITSSDMHGWHTIEHHFSPLISKKLRYIAKLPARAPLRWFGADRVRSFEDEEDLLMGLEAILKEQPGASWYLSVDKDVLAPHEVQTDWDQGIMTTAALLSVLSTFKSSLVGVDVTGEISPYTFRTPWKRFLAGLDGRANIDYRELDGARARHREINAALVQALAEV